ncbi:MAG TPA: polyphenol oxidase family protein [Candidatus Eisenbacteria bacterium]|nr:polyphenol oxidase family protein [Candidatus Eisenbacteria bacterium]
MQWHWQVRGDQVTLRPDPVLPGVGEIGFVGRWRPGLPFLDGQPAVRLDQVHGDRVEEVATSGVIQTCDGARTRVPGLVLTVRTADCIPVLLASTEGIALLHAGWRGLVAGILENGVRGFQHPSAVHAVLGPAIGPCCYEVGSEVAARFPAEALLPGRGERPHLDLMSAARLRLLAAGLPRTAIHAAPFCTRCHQHRLASSRGSGGGPDRIIAFATYRPVGTGDSL